MSPREAVDRVLFIENSEGLGGSTMSLCDILGAVDAARFQPYAVFSRRTQHEYFLRRCQAAAAEAVTIECAPSLRTARFARRALAVAAAAPPPFQRLLFWVLSLLDVVTGVAPYLLRLFRFARRIRIDLIHHNNGFDVAAVVLARLLRVPLIAYQRGEEWNSPLVRYLARWVDLYIANSEATKQSLLALGVPADRMKVLYPPVDFARFDSGRDASRQRREFDVRDTDLCFGIVGVLVDWKGHRTFLEAARQALRAVPGARAFVIGDVPDRDPTYRCELVDLARDLGIGDRVVFTGFRSDIPELLQILDVVVHASVRPEPFGRVIVEAMAMKKAVIASGAGGPLEIVQDGKNGFLVAPGDAAALAERLVALLTDRELAHRLGEQAHRDVRERFSLTAYLDELQSIYALLVATGGRPRGGHSRQWEGLHVTNAK